MFPVDHFRLIRNGYDVRQLRLYRIGHFFRNRPSDVLFLYLRSSVQWRREGSNCVSLFRHGGYFSLPLTGTVPGECVASCLRRIPGGDIQG